MTLPRRRPSEMGYSAKGSIEGSKNIFGRHLNGGLPRPLAPLRGVERTEAASIRDCQTLHCCTTFAAFPGRDLLQSTGGFLHTATSDPPTNRALSCPTDVVGYAQGNLREGFKAAGAQFAPVSGTSVDLTSITVTGYNKEDGSEEEVSVQTLNKNGGTVNQYFWYDVTDGENVYYGWLDAKSGNFIEDGSVTLSIGDGLWADAPNSDYKLMSAGKVMTASAAVSLREGFKMVANPTPVSVDLTAITVTGYNEEEGSEEEVSVQTLNKNGGTVNQYFWYDVTDGKDVYYGWLDAKSGKFIAEGEVTVSAGEALWVDAPSTNYSIVLPGVSL